MNFHVRRRRSPVLQIINMIDILIILLIFLVVSTSFKESHSVLNVSVPVSDALALGTDSERRLGISLTRDVISHQQAGRQAQPGRHRASSQIEALAIDHAGSDQGGERRNDGR